jgi:hypothetical protein
MEGVRTNKIDSILLDDIPVIDDEQCLGQLNLKHDYLLGAEDVVLHVLHLYILRIRSNMSFNKLTQSNRVHKDIRLRSTCTNDRFQQKRQWLPLLQITKAVRVCPWQACIGSNKMQDLVAYMHFVFGTECVIENLEALVNSDTLHEDTNRFHTFADLRFVRDQECLIYFRISQSIILGCPGLLTCKNLVLKA